MKKQRGVTSMTRLIERGEYLKWQSDYMRGVVKAFKHLSDHVQALQDRVAALEANPNVKENK